MITLRLHQVVQPLYYCRKRGEAYSPFPPLWNDWRPFGTSLPSQLKFRSCNIWIAMETAFILWASPSLLPSSRHHGISQPLLGERMLLVALIKSKWFHEGIWWSSTSRAMRCLLGGLWGSAYAQSNLPQENALSQPAADINYESKATAVPPALPVWCWEGLRDWLDRSCGEATDAARTFSYSRKWERLWLYSDLYCCRWIGESRAAISRNRKPSCNKSQLPSIIVQHVLSQKIRLCRLPFCIPAIQPTAYC